MNQKNNNRKFNLLLIVCTFIISFFFGGCQKDKIEAPIVTENAKDKVFARPASKPNPYSLTIINKAKANLAARNITTQNIETDRVFSYIRFNQTAVTGAILKQLEADSASKILAFPFANGEIYTDEFALDENKAKELEDGNLYIVTKKGSSTDNLLKNTISLNAALLDELYLPEETDTTLQYQTLREIGYDENAINRIRFCFFRRPSGFVRYRDTETGALVGTPNIQVWGLVFGIPLHTYTDANGFYRFPWRFNFGTIMGTHAKNWRVNIKPLNTQGAWWLTIPFQFIVGSVHVNGWVTSCAMRNEVNFHFENHRQNRYWAQLLHAVHLHDRYSSNDGIQSAPLALTMYAHWDDNYGDASAPMLGHFNATYAVIEGLINNVFGGNVNLPTNFPNIFNLLTGLLPDITIKVGNFEQQSYSARLMQTAFHELGHGSHFQRAGHQYWLDFIAATLSPQGNCGGYGCGGSADDGNVAVGESWAEFIGTNHALRNHPNGEKQSVWQGGFIRFDDALEREIWFFNNWIPTGIYNDLIDVTNNDPTEDNWDNVGGLSIQQLYQVLGPKIDEICIYRRELLGAYPFLDQNLVNNIFIIHGYRCF